MKIRLILSGLTILFLLASCSKAIFLFPDNTGSYGSSPKTNQIATAPVKNSLKENTEAIVAATGKEIYPAINHNSAKAFVQTAPATSISNHGLQKNTALKLTRPAFAKNETKLVGNYLKAILVKNTNQGTKEISKESTGYTFSILSFLIALAGIILTFSLGKGLFLLLGIPAIFFGSISLAKKEKLRGLALAGLILGLLEAVLILLIIFSDIYIGN